MERVFGKRKSVVKAAALALALITAFGFIGCGGYGEAYAPSASSAAGPTEAPTAAPTAAPTEEPVIIPADAEEAVAAFEAYPLDFEPVSRPKAEPQAPVPAPRYVMGEGAYYAPDAPNDNKAVIMLAGDLMCQTRQQEAGRTDSGWSFEGGFDYVRDIFAEADLVVGNLEATLSESAPYMSECREVEGKPHLNAPACFLEAVRNAGFDMVVMSNNHNCDAGVRGIYETLDRVDEYGLMHTGLFRSAEEERVCVIDVDGVRVCVLSYSTYFNHKEKHLTSGGISSMLNRYSRKKAQRDIAAARRAGAEFVFVYIHWGKEYSNEPTLRQLCRAKELADAGADFIVGSHPHALQPYAEVISADGRSVPVMFSMGNFISHQNKTVSKDTLILRVALERNGEGEAVISECGYIPCRVFKTFRGRDYAVVPVVKPYNKGRKSKYFAPAYERITGIIGDGIDILGELDTQSVSGTQIVPGTPCEPFVPLRRRAESVGPASGAALRRLTPLHARPL